jgi:hypothetical protein
MTSYQPLPLCDATLKMIDQTIANDQVGVLGHRFDLSQYKELLEEADDVADYFCCIPTVTIGTRLRG